MSAPRRIREAAGHNRSNAYGEGQGRSSRERRGQRSGGYPLHSDSKALAKSRFCRGLRGRGLARRDTRIGPLHPADRATAARGECGCASEMRRTRDPGPGLPRAEISPSLRHGPARGGRRGGIWADLRSRHLVVKRAGLSAGNSPGGEPLCQRSTQGTPAFATSDFGRESIYSCGSALPRSCRRGRPGRRADAETRSRLRFR